MTATATRARPAVTRTCNLIGEPGFEQLHVEIATERKTKPPKVERCVYLLRRLRSDWGRAFRLYKTGGAPEVYDVLLDDEGRDHCDCKGFLSHGKCKHRDSLRVLVQAGRL